MAVHRPNRCTSHPSTCKWFQKPVRINYYWCNSCMRSAIINFYMHAAAVWECIHHSEDLYIIMDVGGFALHVDRERLISPHLRIPSEKFVRDVHTHAHEHFRSISKSDQRPKITRRIQRWMLHLDAMQQKENFPSAAWCRFSKYKKLSASESSAFYDRVNCLFEFYLCRFGRRWDFVWSCLSISIRCSVS